MPKVSSKKKAPLIQDSNLRVLFIGDIVGEVGREAVKKILPSLKKNQAIDVVIANGEHLSERVGVDIKYVQEMHASGIDLFTTGNHVWRKKEFEEHIGKADVPVIRPANFSGNVPGEDWRVLRTGKGNLLVLNLIGEEHIEARGIMDEEGPQRVNQPFVFADEVLAKVKGYTFSIVDFHAEMTSEKVAMGHYLKGRVGALLGTHTHVPTADAAIFNGTAYVTDVGMTGPADSVLGVKSEIIIERFKSGQPLRFELAEGPAVFNSVLITFNQNGKAKSIKRIDKKTT